MSEPLTAQERATLKTAGFGAVFLVSNADPGLLAMIRESFAASGAFADSAGMVKEALTTGDLPRLPRHSVAEVEAEVLPALRRSVEILRAKAPQELDRFRATVLAAIDQVAQAAGGVSGGEAGMVVKVRGALGLPVTSA